MRALAMVSLSVTLALTARSARAAEGPATADLDAPSYWKDLARPGLGRSRDLLRQTLLLLDRATGAFPGTWEPVCERSLALPLPANSDAARRGRSRALAQLARGVLARRAYLEGALARVDRALAIDPDAVPLLYARARALAAWEEPQPTWTCAARRRTREALEAFEHLVRVDPGFRPSEVAFEFALALSHAGRYDEAARAYQRVMALALDEREAPAARGNFAEMTMLAGRLEEAVGHYERALALAVEPRSVLLARWGLAVALDRLGEHERAIDQARRAIEAEGGTMRVLRSDDVFYEPSHEIRYYEALGHEALATRDGADRATALAAAARAWRDFLAGAGPTGRFSESARRNAERVEMALATQTTAHEGKEPRTRRGQRVKTTADTLP
jgi:tetratricopeptide (TPR) repeat protein